MPTLLLRLAIAFALAVPGRAQDPVPDPAQAPRLAVDRTITQWLRREERSHQELADALVGLGKEAAPYLCELLEGGRGGAPAESLAEALGRVGYSRATAPLGRLLGSKVASERLSAVEALGALGDRDGYTHLALAVMDPEPSVATRAEAILLAEDSPSAWVALAVEERLRVTISKSRLARLLGKKGGDETHAVLLRLAGDWRQVSQLAALEGLYLAARPEDADIVTELLVIGASDAVRKQACLVLGKLEARGATRDLIDALGDGDRGLAANAYWALCRITGLKLKPDPELWEQWWARVGKKLMRAARLGPPGASSATR